MSVYIEPLKSLSSIEGWDSSMQYTPNAQGISVGGFGQEVGVRAHFKLQPYVDEAQTEANKFERRIIAHKEHCVIRPLADKFTVWDQPVRPQDKIRFAREYQAFKSGKEENRGVPLESWEYQLASSELLTLRVLGYQYVHEIASMPDDQCDTSGILDMRKIRARARLSCSEEAEKDAAATLNARFEEQSKLMAKMQEEINQMHAIREIKEKEARGMEERQEKSFEKAARGRPRKDSFEN